MSKPFNTTASLRRLQIIGYTSIFAMVAIFGGWSAATTINGAVIASSTIVSESNTKRIQQKEGGIVRQILVKDGDHVMPGQDLVILDDTDTKAELGIINGLLDEESAKRARLEAVRDGLDKIAFPEDLLARRGDPAVDRILTGQEHLFDARRASLAGKKDQLTQQIGQMGEQIDGMAAQIAAKQSQIELVQDDLKSLTELLSKGLVAKSRVLEDQRMIASLEGEKGELIANKAGAAIKISEIKLAILQIDEDERTQSLTDVRDSEGKIAEYMQRKASALGRLSRTSVKSPIEGDVYQLALHTIGGVIQPAETLMLIAPATDELVLQAQVTPQNIDQVHVGQLAKVRFPAFNSRFTPEIHAEVTQVAADVSRTDQNSPAFYAVRLHIAPDELAKLNGEKLKPGMPAEAFIQTSERSPLSYLLKPLNDQIAHAFREK